MPGVAEIQADNVYRLQLAATDEPAAERSLEGSDGWLVDSGRAVIRGRDLLHLLPSDPPARISRDFPGIGKAQDVFLGFRFRGRGAGPLVPLMEVLAPDLVHLSLVAEEGEARLYAFDGDGQGGGAWLDTAATVELDGGDRVGDVSVGVHIDIQAGYAALYVDRQAAGRYRFSTGTAVMDRLIIRTGPGSELRIDELTVGTDRESWAPAFAGEQVDAEGRGDARTAGRGRAVKARGPSDVRGAENVPAKIQRAERSFQTSGARIVWLTMQVPGRPGRLPAAAARQGPRSAMVAVNPAGFLFAYDGVKDRWVNSGVAVGDRGSPARVDLRLDFESGRYWLCVDGVLVLRDLGFRDRDIRQLQRIRLRAGLREEVLRSPLNAARISFDEPSGLDFSGDGLTNQQKRMLGLDVFRKDTTGDGIPDWWLVKHGLDATDPAIGDTDPRDKGLSVRQDFFLGTSPNLVDTDGDGWEDVQEYLADTDPLDSSRFPEDEGLNGWKVVQIGKGLAAEAFRVEDEYRLAGSGIGTHRKEDAFLFAYREVTGDFEATVRVQAPEHLAAGMETVPSWLSQNGLMARSTLDPAAPYSALFSSPVWYWSRFRELPGANVTSFTLRSVIAGESHFIRMRRTGNRFRHYLSSDGQTWFLMSDLAVEMPKRMLVGMFASAFSETERIRGRLSQVELVPISEGVQWQRAGESGSVKLDSFAWLGEWDGTGDHDRAALTSRRPKLNELHQAGFSTPAVQTFHGSDAREWNGTWRRSGNSLIGFDRRGWIEFDLKVAEPDVYLVELEAREWNKDKRTISLFPLKFYLDSDFLGSRTLEASSDELGRVYVFTPWLESGTHRLRVLWDGSRSETYLDVCAVRLRVIDGGHEEGPVKSWVAARLMRQAGIDHPPPTLTYISPLRIEGRAQFSRRMIVQREVNLREPFHAGGRPLTYPKTSEPEGSLVIEPPAVPFVASKSEAETFFEPRVLAARAEDLRQSFAAWREPTAFAARQGAGYRFWSEIPLVPLVENAVTVAWQSGVATYRQAARWIPFNIMQGGTMALQVGDSMLLTAHNGDSENGQAVISVGGKTYTTVPEAPVMYTFQQPGEYEIEGVYRHPDGREFSSLLKVSASDFTFSGRPLAYVGRERSWNPSDSENVAGKPTFEGDPRLALRQDDSRSKLYFSAVDNIPQTLVARDPATGAIIDSVSVESFRLFSSWETYARIIEELPDGTKLVEMLLILSPVPPDLSIQLEIFAGGVLFDDGTTTRWLSKDDFDVLGQTTVRFIMPEDAVSSVCHRTNVYQNGQLIGSR